MLETERMSKIRMVVSTRLQAKVISRLHELKVLHIIEHKKSMNNEQKNEPATDNTSQVEMQAELQADIGTPLEDSEHIAGLLVRVKSLLSTIDANHLHPSKLNNSSELNHKTSFNELPSFVEIEAALDRIEASLKGLLAKAEKLEHDIQQKKERTKKLELLNSLYLSLESYHDFKSLACYVGTIRDKTMLKESLAEITSKFKLHTSQYENSISVALFVERKKQAEALELLRMHGFNELNLEFAKNMQGSVLKQLNSVAESITALDAKKQKIDASITILKKGYYHVLRRYQSFLEKESEVSEAPLQFAQTRQSTFITGWVPTAKLESITQDLEKLTKNKVFVESIAIDKKESIPVKLKNKLAIKPFEFFMRLYTLPKYKEIDPSFFIFLTFPLFFGFMLGDVGYGVITLLLFILLKKLIPAGKDILNAMMSCSIFSIIFGFMFGEYFGFEYVKSGVLKGILDSISIHLEEAIVEGHVVYEFPRLLNRMHGEMNVFGNNIPTVLVIGAIIGIVHINISILLGFINEYKDHGIKEAILAKLSWYVFEAGLALIIFNALGMSSYSLYGIICIVVSLIMVYLGEGVQGLIEIPALFSNTLSYLRLGAVGLASVGLAIVINERLALPFIEKGGIFILVGILILILGHTINIALGIIGPFLHAIRLHYVEFFNRFYKGGGKLYRPFGAKHDGT